METNRIINIVLADLALNTLKHQEELEYIMNLHSEDIDNKVAKIKGTLKQLIENDLMIQKFQSLINLEK